MTKFTINQSPTVFWIDSNKVEVFDASQYYRRLNIIKKTINQVFHLARSCEETWCIDENSSF
jgi:hypothetical protein